MIKKLLIRAGKLTKILNSKTPQAGKVKAFGTTKEVVLINPAGFFSYPDKSVTALMFQVSANEDNVVAIPFDPEHRPDIEKGDVGIGTLNGKMTITLSKDGKITIKGATDDMIALISEALGYIQDTATNLASTTVPTALGASSLSSAGLFGTMAGDAGTLKGKFDAMVKT